MLPLGGALLAASCTSAPSAAPFHMYTSPLLEGEHAPLDPAAGERHYQNGARPGVQERQVYSYRRWGHDAEKRPRQIRPEAPTRAPLDTVTPPDRPVLRNYREVAIGAGRTHTDDHGGSEKPPAESNLAEAPKESRFDANELAAGYIFTLLRVNEIPIGDEAATSIPEIFRYCRAEGGVYHSSRPNVGDLVFFHNTYDVNDDGRNNDWYTLVGIVEAVQSNGTVDFLAYNRDVVIRQHVNLDEPSQRHLTGQREINSRLRNEAHDDAPFTQYLAGQLFAGYCNILGDRDDLIVIDNWSPDLEVE